MKRVRSLVSAAAIAFAVLCLAPSSSAAPWHGGGSRGGFHGRGFARHDGFGFHGRGGRFFAGHGRFFPGHGRFFDRGFALRGFHRPFRLVRVFVYAPYPHWAFRRVYYAAPFDPYCGY